MALFPPIMVVAVPSSSGGNKEWLLEATHRRYTMDSDLALTSSLEFTQHVVSIEPLAAEISTLKDRLSTLTALYVQAIAALTNGTTNTPDHTLDDNVSTV